MDNILALVAGTLFGVFALAAEILMYISKRNTWFYIMEHNRKVLLGVNSERWDISVKEEGIHESGFFRLENSGTYDTSFILECDYHPYGGEDDLYLED